MTILLTFAFISGFLTILAPCIWPLLPIILGGASKLKSKAASLGLSLGIAGSFSLLTLALSYLVKSFGVDPELLRLISGLIIIGLGLILVIPKLSQTLEGFVSRLSWRLTPTKTPTKGFLAGFFTGGLLGVVWSPCAGPILATIATLSATRTVNLEVTLIMFAFGLGLILPLFLFAYGGSVVINKSRFLSPFTGLIQQFFGLVIIVTAFGILRGYDRIIEARLLDLFPSYSNFLYQIEGRDAVQKELERLKTKKPENPQTALKPNLKSETEAKFMPNLLDNLLSGFTRAPEFVGTSGWQNTDHPLTMSELRGKVVLVDFWTYTCINCIRTLPHVTGWYEKYKDKGLVVVGVHTPEFEFEKKAENVAQAIKDYKIHYPVAQDNDYLTWQAYANHYWPAEYLIDAQGRIRHSHFGEGEYDQTELAIQALLKEAGQPSEVSVSSTTDQTPRLALTPESYVGYARLARFASVEAPRLGRQNYSLPQSLGPDNLALGGFWTLEDESATAAKGASLVLNFYANRVFLVMTPRGPKDSLKIYLDGQPLGQDLAGQDVNEGRVVLDTARLYNLVDLHGQAGRHLLKLEFESEGTQVYAFTFG